MLHSKLYNPKGVRWPWASSRGHRAYGGVPTRRIYVGDWRSEQLEGLVAPDALGGGAYPAGGEPDDVNGTGTLDNPYSNITRFLEACPMSQEELIEVWFAPGDHVMPATGVGFNFQYWQGLLHVASTRAVTGVTVSSTTDGTVVSHDGDPLVAGTLIAWLTGPRAGQRGRVVYSDGVDEIKVASKEAAGLSTVEVGDTFEVLEMKTRVLSADTPAGVSLRFLGCSQWTCDGIDFGRSGGNRQWFFMASDKIVLEDCLISDEVANFTAAYGGGIWLRNTWVMAKDVNGMVQAAQSGELHVQIGTVVDGSASNNGGIAIQDGQLYFLGESYFLNLDSRGIQLESSRVGMKNGDDINCVVRIHECTDLFRFNKAKGGSGGGGYLPAVRHLHGSGTPLDSTGFAEVDRGAKVYAKPGSVASLGGTNVLTAGSGGAVIYGKEDGTVARLTGRTEWVVWDADFPPLPGWSAANSKMKEDVQGYVHLNGVLDMAPGTGPGAIAQFTRDELMPAETVYFTVPVDTGAEWASATLSVDGAGNFAHEGGAEGLVYLSGVKWQSKLALVD